MFYFYIKKSISKITYLNKNFESILKLKTLITTKQIMFLFSYHLSKQYLDTVNYTFSCSLKDNTKKP